MLLLLLFLSGVGRIEEDARKKRFGRLVGEIVEVRAEKKGKKSNIERES